MPFPCSAICQGSDLMAGFPSSQVSWLLAGFGRWKVPTGLEVKGKSRHIAFLDVDVSPCGSNPFKQAFNSSASIRHLKFLFLVSKPTLSVLLINPISQLWKLLNLCPDEESEPPTSDSWWIRGCSTN